MRANDKFVGLTTERLRKALAYNPATGDFTWRISRRNGVREGKRAGSIDANGYVIICFRGRRYKAHRLAWIWMTGERPPEEIDHINGSRSDNRFSNLRLATHAENLRNSKTPINNKSGVKGVHWHPQCKKWAVRITVKDRNLYLGLFTDIGDAAAAYEKAAKKYYGEFARL